MKAYRIKYIETGCPTEIKYEYFTSLEKAENSIQYLAPTEMGIVELEFITEGKYRPIDTEGNSLMCNLWFKMENKWLPRYIEEITIN